MEPGQLGSNRIEQFSRCNLRPFEGRAVSVRHRDRVQRSVHVTRIERDELDSFGASSAFQIALNWRSAALLAPYAPQ